MFTELVKSLPIENIPVKIYLREGDNFIRLKPSEYLVEDIGIPIQRGPNPFLPDYAIKGYYDNGSFYIEPQNEGPHTIYITGVPIEDDINPKFYVKPWFPIVNSHEGAISYWQDNKVGYLFQIC